MNYKNIFFVSDLHGDMNRLNLIKNLISKEDLLIVLGDSCLDCHEKEDGFLSHSDFVRQKWIKQFSNGCDIAVVQGNHDRPFEEMNAKKVNKFDSIVYENNDIFFIPNGSILNINNYKCLVIGGACSIDRDSRKQFREESFLNEEISNEKMIEILTLTKGKHFDFVLTHTSPSKHIKNALLKEKIKVSRTEKFLDTIENNITYNHWFCGHLHKDYSDQKFKVIYNNALVFNKVNGLKTVYGMSHQTTKK